MALLWVTLAVLCTVRSAFAQSPVPDRLKDPLAAKQATKCAASIAAATSSFLTAQLKHLRACVKKTTACVQTTAPEKQSACLRKAKKPCDKAIVSLQAAERLLETNVSNDCPSIDALKQIDGLGFINTSEICREFGIDLDTPLDLARCLNRIYRRTTQRLFSVQSPRSRELIALSTSESRQLQDLPGYDGCNDCAVGDLRTGKAITTCDKAVSASASRLSIAALTAINRCYQALFKCEQLALPEDLQLCRRKAAVKCEQARKKQQQAREKSHAAIRSSCIATYSQYRSESGSNTGALGCECELVGVTDLGSFENYLTCFSRQHECRAADLTRAAAPRIDELFEASQLSLPDILCAQSPSNASPLATGSRASCRFSVGICRFIRNITGKFAKNGKSYVPGIAKVSSPKNISTASSTGPARSRAVSLQVSGAKAVAPGESRRFQVNYQSSAATPSSGRTTENQLVIAVQRLDGTLVENEAFVGPLDKDDVQLNLNVEYPSDVPGCGFRLVFGVDDGNGIGDLIPVDLLAAKCLGARNNLIEAGEECDDGNDQNEDACTNLCRRNECGDGFRNPAKEQCDDANLEDADSCSSDCTIRTPTTPTTPTPLHTPNLPVGVILDFGRGEPPAGYLLCNGASINRNTYAALFAVIGTQFGGGDGVSTFNLPDLRGRFTRGVDGGAGNDPDAASRTQSKPGGSTGDAVGSLQADATGPHSHRIKLLPSAGTQSGSAAAGPSDISEHFEGAIQPSGTGIRSESRPKNVNVNKMIKYE